MSLILLSKKIIPQEETLKSIVISSIKANLRFILNENCISEFGAVEAYIDRNYGKVKTEDLEYFYLNIHSESFYKNQLEEGLMDFKVDSDKYYGIAGTDQVDHNHLIYDFALEYLRLQPNHCISLYGETFFFLKDMEKLESQGGYYKDWCF